MLSITVLNPHLRCTKFKNHLNLRSNRPVTFVRCNLNLNIQFSFKMAILWCISGRFGHNDIFRNGCNELGQIKIEVIKQNSELHSKILLIKVGFLKSEEKVKRKKNTYGIPVRTFITIEMRSGVKERSGGEMYSRWFGP